MATRTKTPLDTYDYIPEDMRMYLSNYGRHFSKKMYENAVSEMRPRTGGKIKPVSKEEFESKMRQHGIELENNVLYDGNYVWSMATADFFGSSIEDEKHLALYVKDYIDDPDASDGQVFNRYYSDTVLAGEPIDWLAML